MLFNCRHSPHLQRKLSSSCSFSCLIEATLPKVKPPVVVLPGFSEDIGEAARFDLIWSMVSRNFSCDRLRSSCHSRSLSFARWRSLSRSLSNSASRSFCRSCSLALKSSGWSRKIVTHHNHLGNRFKRAYRVQTCEQGTPVPFPSQPLPHLPRIFLTIVWINRNIERWHVPAPCEYDGASYIFVLVPPQYEAFTYSLPLLETVGSYLELEAISNRKLMDASKSCLHWINTFETTTRSKVGNMS